MITIPQRLKEKLKVSTEWDTNVNSVILNVSSLFGTTPYFFPEYTNHGETHINNVLIIVDKLIPDVSLKVMTEKEVGVLIVSLILHDIGMFISFDGFACLLNDEKICIDLEQNETVEQIWKRYLVEIKHLSEKEMREQFGTTEISVPLVDNENSLDNKSKLIIGEFLRKNHHSISHILIQKGLGGIDFLNGTRVDNQIRDLIGLIARSHGMDIRSTERYLKSHYTRISQPKNISVFYIMTLVRMADYLDAGEERASHVISALFVKTSSRSKREFAWNQCLKHEDFIWEEKKECISIDASPQDAIQFIDVKKWTNGIQTELDLCWAVIGEHYDPAKYKMTIRRIKSNLDQKEVVSEYEKKFHTQEALLDANADILKLLIAPLYGDNPSFGVRELLQNAVDACREREKKEKDIGRTYEGVISINLNTKKKEIVFVDNGIGMPIDVIKKYYLVAGASYRRSDAWSKDFVEEGKTRVLRNGKFGIGVLATFLLGERATITTRSMEEEKGWEFSIQLDQDNICIKRVATEIGTKVSIELTDTTIEKLNKDYSWGCCKWNEWYVEETPKVQYSVDGKELTSYKINWKKKSYELEQNEYNKYMWSYEYLFRYGNGEVCCNGIMIPSSYSFNRSEEYRFRVERPYLNIEDFEGKLPIDLARSRLLAIPCEKELYIECCKYSLAKLLCLDFQEGQHKSKFSKGYSYWDVGDYIVYSKKGYTLCDPAFLEMANVKKINILVKKDGGFDGNIAVVKSDVPFILHREDIRRVTKKTFESLLSNSFFATEYIEQKLSCLHIEKKSYEYVRDRMQKKKWSDINIKEGEGKYLIWPGTAEVSESIDFSITDFPLVAECQMNVIGLKEDDIMLGILKRYFKQSGYIPYDINERKKLFSEAFCELKQYMI